MTGEETERRRRALELFGQLVELPPDERARR